MPRAELGLRRVLLRAVLAQEAERGCGERAGGLRGCSAMKQRLRERRLVVWREGPARGRGCFSGGC